jgi:enediyne biosynthesis protein E4
LQSHESWKPTAAGGPTRVFGYYYPTDPTMPDHLFKRRGSASSPELAQASRRDFLRQLGAFGSIIPTSLFLPTLGETLGLQKPRRSPATRKSGIMSEPRASFHFTDVSTQAGLGQATNIFGGVARKQYLLEEIGCGLALFDYDNDGWMDLFLVNGTRFEDISPDRQPTNSLFRNNRDGSFTDVTEKAGLVRSGWGQGCCVGDYDNDGLDDLVVTYWGGIVLYHNNGDGTFTDVTEKAGLAQKSPTPRWNTGCCFVDYDRDGYLDLFVANYVNFDPQGAPLPGDNQYCRYFGLSIGCGPQGLSGGTNILYHNRGDGTFEDVSERSGVAVPRGPAAPSFVSEQWIPAGSYGLGVCAADFDNDGWPDIYVACDSVPSRFYHNNHDGTFEEIGTQIGCAVNEGGVPQGGMGVAAGDYDCDGWLDIVKTNYSDQTANLYHNNGDGTFYDAVFQAGVGANTKYLGWGVGLFDFDNDGWPDIFMSNGHVFPEVDTKKLHVTFKQRKIVYRNLGHGRFIDVTSSAGPAVNQPRPSRGTAFGDFDNDGDVDVAIINMNEPPSLLRNDSPSQNNWLKIKCVGTKSNRSGIGARVRVVTGRHSQINEVTSGSSFLSQNDFRLHFGVGTAKQADLVEVRWPLGLVESFKNIETNEFLVLQEGHGILRREKLGKQ